MAQRICRTSKGRFKKCGTGGTKRKVTRKRKSTRKASACKFGKVKSGARKGQCRKVRRKRK